MTSKKPAKARKKPAKARKKIMKVFSSPADKSQQVAALPWCETENGLEIMLVSSRETRRWIIPKGWPMAGRKNSAAAAIEALEEAGLLGVISEEPIDQYSYVKRLARREQSVRVEVFSMRVLRQRDHWREWRQRVTQWFTAEEAAELVDDAELRDVIARFIRHREA
jgi:8-oxo-dGTP pyrophosphatase MutT (NUDIX family)